jgi:hypothetical protein
MTTTPQRGNRSTGDVEQYTRMLLTGKTLDEVGDFFGVSHGAVRKALKRRGLPTNSRALLAAIPTGCTPTDAEVLRRANHALAEENTKLKERLTRIQSALKGLE